MAPFCWKPAKELTGTVGHEDERDQEYGARRKVAAKRDAT
jgi:hypothetical protein